MEYWRVGESDRHGSRAVKVRLRCCHGRIAISIPRGYHLKRIVKGKKGRSRNDSTEGLPEGMVASSARRK